MKKISYVVLVAVLLIAVIVIWRSAKTNPTNPSNLVASAQYSCDAGKTIQAQYYKGTDVPGTADTPPVPGGTATVTLSDGRVLNLAQTLSADGTRYANPDETFVFWSKGNGALVLENNENKSYIGCVLVAPESASSGLPAVYSNGEQGFSIRLPALATSTGSTNAYVADESYMYQASPTKKIYGVKFTIPKQMVTGTNLGQDSYIAVEEIPQTTSCSASIFFDGTHTAQTVTEGDVTYSVASSTGAGAGNRYEETVYAIPGTNPCVAVRYLVHYGVIQNYPEGSTKEFDMGALISEFDKIRKTLVVNQ